MFYVTLDEGGRVQTTHDVPLPPGAVDCSGVDEATKLLIIGRKVIYDGATWVPVADAAYDPLAIIRTLTPDEVASLLDVMRATGKLSAATDEQLAATAVMITPPTLRLTEP